MEKRKTAGNLFSAAGAVLIAGALGLCLYNRYTAETAGRESGKAVSRFMEYVSEINEESEQRSSVLPDDYEPVLFSMAEKYTSENESPENAAEEIPVFEADGFSFAAVIEIPVLDLILPVCSEFSMDTLKYYPCVYSGTVNENNIIIAAHNYESHFGNIKSLQSGDEVILTDAAGNRIIYQVTETEVISGERADDMTGGSWDMTLFSCNLSGKSRITVRLIRKNNSECRG